MSQPANDEFSQHLSDDEASNHEDASDTGAAPKQQQQVIPQTTAISNIKLPILKKEEYDIWAMEMEHYLEYIDNDVWKVIQNGNSKKRISTGKDGVVRILPPVSPAEIHAVEKERKARTILLMAIPKEHLRRFHGMDDAKEIWEAIRTRFGGNANSKKMQKAVLKQQFKRDYFYQDQGAGKKEQKQNCLLTMDDGIVNWGEHTKVEETNHALMAISSSNEVTLCSKTCIDSYNKLKTLYDEQMNQLGDQEAQILAYSQAVKKLEAQLVTFQKQQLSLNEKLTFQANEIYEKDEKLKKYRRIGMKAVKEKEQLQKTLDSWKDSSKNLWRLINSGMSSNSKVGLGYEIQSNNEVLSYEEEMNFSVFNCSEEDSVGKPLYNRFIKTNDFKGVPHPLSGDYTPTPQEEIDESLYVYGKKGPQEPEPSVSDDRSSEYSTCQSNDSAGSIGTSSEHSVDPESEISRVPPEVYVSTPITTNEKGVSAPKSKEVEPSCVSHIKTPRQPIKDQETPKVNRKNWNKMMERELGEGYSFIKKKCFVCGSLSHLIKDCDYYEKKMAREAEFKKQRVFNTGNGVAKPVWTNANRVNHANQFVPRSVQLNAGRPNINSVRPNINTGRTNINSVRPNINTGRTNINSVRPNINTGRVNVNSVRPNVNTGRVNVNSVKSNVNTGRTNVNPVRPRVNTDSSNVNTVRSRQPVPTKTSNSFSLKKPQVNQLNQRRHFTKSHSPVSRPIVRNTTRMTYSHAVKGNWGTAVKTSAGYNWRKTRPNSNYDSRSNFVKTVNVKGPQGRPKPVKAWPDLWIVVLRIGKLQGIGEFSGVGFISTRQMENDDYACRGIIFNGMSDSLFDIYQNVESEKELWDSLEYMTEDVSSKKFLKDFKHTLKHKKEELTLAELGSHLRIEESLGVQDSDKPKGNNIVGPSVVNKDDDVAWWVDSGATVYVCNDRCWFKTYESLDNESILHVGNESTALVHRRGCVDLRFSSRKIVSLFNVLHVPNIRKNLV
ncbi:hypothetical protein Tco_1017293 [Tanacetum coccineum]|uniref:Retrovirus-related Pol polyprotein from transposon TNT 1-94-like beta-barrel domain-containing protein n=1 Tax=Tanacetum coccineum TaxID=301880 RepID=A0ABQ5FSG4_9ASTR